MTLKQIKQAVDNGLHVGLAGGGYEVIKDDLGQYLVHCLANDNYIGLHGRKGTRFENVTTYPLAAFRVDMTV